ncbi:hypothetical protein FC961_00265 [Clostridium botulinum]|nr:hypothetical protein [Clostridium botulinum]NFO90288.1 hypothetical protein [Clostridium botulinum]
MSNIHNLQTDLDLKDNVLISVACKQLDDLELELDIWNNGQEIDLSNYSCRLTAIKIDGVPFIQDTAYTIVKNKVKIQCERQLTATQGITKADLIFIDKATKKQKHSFDLDIIVKPSVLSRGGEISKPTLTLLEQIDKKLDEIENIGQVLDEAKKTRDDLVVKTNIANESEKNLIQTTTAADNKKKEVENTISNANKKVIEVNTSIDNANNTKNSLISTAAEKVKELKDTADLEKQSIINTVDIKKEEVNKLISNADTKKVELENTITTTITKQEQLGSANVQAEKNIETLNSFGDASKLTKDVTTLKTKVLENTLTSITTDSTLTKLPNSENSFVRNMLIRGKTLQNLQNYFEGDITRTFTNGSSMQYSIFGTPLNKLMLKPDTKYTFILDFKTVNGEFEFEIGDTIAGEARFLGRKSFKISSTGRYIGTLSTRTDFSKCVLDDRSSINISPNSGQVNVSFNFMILEGDWTGKETPPYFEGIKSVGELEGNKISILSTGKNLFNGNLPITVTAQKAGEAKTFNTKIIAPNGITIFAIDSNGNAINNSNIALGFYNKDGSYSFKPFWNAVYIPDVKDVMKLKVFWNNLNDNDITISKIMIGLGKLSINELMSYEPYKEDKTTILIPNEPLRGLPVGTSDIVDFDKNELTRNIGKAVLNGSENIRIGSGLNQTNTIYFYLNIANAKQQNRSNIGTTINNKIIDGNYSKIFNNDIEGIAIGDDGELKIRILKTKLPSPDVNGIKNLLKTWSDAGTPLEVYYQVANPVIEKLTIKDTLQTFQDGYIQLDNAITPFTSLEYSTNIPSAIGGLTKVVDHNVDEITNIESTISDMDAEVDEARKGKATLNERLEDDRTNILKKFNDYAKKDGTLQTGLNAEMLAGLKAKDFQKVYGGDINDFNTTLTQGEYSFNNGALHQPNNYKNYGKLIVLVSDGGTHNNLNNWIWQIMYPTEPSIGIWYRNKSNDGSWSEWKQIATTERPQEFNITPVNGFTLASGSKATYFKTQDNVVTLNGFLNNSGSASTNIVMFNLPAGYRNTAIIRARGFVNTFIPCEIYINVNGDVWVNAIQGGISNYGNIQFDVSFLANR